VNHAGGATPVTVNQEVNGGQWNLLGTFTLNAGSSHSVVLAIQDDGYVIADAIKVVPQGAAPSTATWTPVVPTAKAYHVYARWTAHPNRATDAKYTVTHAGGETTVTINQEVNNGAWVQLGTFNLAPASGHKVSLTDQANGYVIADAIRLIGTDEPQANSATWSPNLTGEHQVYAKWTANPNRATNATYTVTHAGGSTPIAVNQQANGGQFNLLGTFTLSPASTITLTDNANGFVIADAIQLIATAATPLALYFVHTDHLNTPRLIANGTGQAVWSWANDDPFGANAPNENPSGLGTFTCNLRLPGQYFDKESNLHYNMARDYDPTLGRYIESDPVGLKAGLNTYLYAIANPLSYVDLDGLLGRVPGPRPVGGQAPGSSPCSYYDEVCARTKCPYYCVLAPRVCRSPNIVPTFWGISDESMSCIRNCLIAQDKVAWSKPSNIDCDGCIKPSVIDNYHCDCFDKCGVGSWRYPGYGPVFGFPCLSR